VSGGAELVAIKKAARAAALARRAEAAEVGDGAAGAARLREVLADKGARVLSGYMPMRGEIDPLPAMAAHAGRVCVPVTPPRGNPLSFREWTPDARMVEGPFKAMVPEDGDWLVPEVLIVPLLAFDRRGYRLGYGGGYYDRTLESLRSKGPVTAIGYAWAAQETDAVPLEPTDQPLDLIVTDAGVIYPRG
jgi:5-formyltetrahydrofolate cyclo-ligase